MSLLYVVRKNTEESRINQYNERERKAIKYQRKLDRQWNIIGSKIIRKIDKAILKASKKGKASIQVDSFKFTRYVERYYSDIGFNIKHDSYATISSEICYTIISWENVVSINS